METNDSIVLLGATMVDYIGFADDKFKKGTSNPGHLKMSTGGVGHNIAVNLARLGDKVDFFTGIGNDEDGDKLLAEMQNEGINVFYPERKYPSSTYLAVLDEKGDLQGGVSDARATEAINLKFLQKHDELIRSHLYLFLDTNLAPVTIADILRYYPEKKLCVEAVSKAKAKKIKRFLPRIYLIKGNKEELRSLTSLKKDASGEDIVNELRKTGVQNAIATAGKDGIYFASPFETRHIPAVDINQEKVISVIGAGDALYSGFIHGFIRGWNFTEALKFGELLADEVLISKEATARSIGKYRDYDPSAKKKKND